MITRDTDTRLTAKEAVTLINTFESSQEFRRIENYKKYYEVENPYLINKVTDRHRRGVTPNNMAPTAYYKTVVDSMSGYMFQNISYEGNDLVNDILKSNKAPIKDMQAGVNALAYNKAIELAYTRGDQSALEMRFAPVDPLTVTLVYDDTIEPELYCAIRKYKGKGKEKYRFSIIYKDMEQTFAVTTNKDSESITQIGENKQLLWDSVPVVVYKTEIITDNSSFDQILDYIDVLDWLITGNANEIDKLADSILLLSKQLDAESLDKLREAKVLDGLDKEDVASYLERTLDPQMREYFSNLLIQEIHKHCHVIDWYSPDSGLQGVASGKALRFRLTDMFTFSNRVEKVFRSGAEKRIDLILNFLKLQSLNSDPVTIRYTRSIPSDLEGDVQALAMANFISDETKIQLVGIDPETELPKLEAQRERELGAPINSDI